MRASNARPYEVTKVTTKPVTSGMGKPIPYRVQAKLLHQISTITAYSDPSASSPYAGEPRGSVGAGIARPFSYVLFRSHRSG